MLHVAPGVSQSLAAHAPSGTAGKAAADFEQLLQRRDSGAAETASPLPPSRHGTPAPTRQHADQP
jgi:hypothetical protein